MRRVKHARAVSRLTRPRGFSASPRGGAASRFHVAQNINSVPPRPSNERRFAIFAARNLFSSAVLAVIAFENGAAARYDKTHARSFRAAPPICGDTPLFFLSRSFSLPLPFFRRCLNRDNRSTVRERSREISGKISRIYLHVTEAQSGTDLSVRCTRREVHLTFRLSR